MRAKAFDDPPTTGVELTSMRPIYALGTLVLLSAPAAGQAPTPLARGRAARSAALDQTRQTAIVDAAAKVSPAVVSVNVLKRSRQVTRDPFDFFFVPRESERTVEGFGSGFVVSRDGIVITNQHVTEGADQIVVTMRDGRDYPAKLLGEDPLTDIAVLKIEGTNLPTTPLGASNDLQIGEWVVAIGNPYAYLLGNSEPTVTAGVVSAVGRNLLPSRGQTGVYVGMIQTDAAINPGNSGGPLCNALGHVIGVNSSIFSNTGGSVGIGFAIPIERALRVAEELRRFGKVRRAWVGLDVASAQDLRAWKTTGGLKVGEVANGGPAHRAGVSSGDILIEAGGRKLRTFLDWEAVLLDTGPGDTLVVRSKRGSRDQTARMVVVDLPTSVAQQVAVLGDLKVITLSAAVRQERGVQVDQGVLIADLGIESQRATGLQPGDVIFQVNRQKVSDAEELERLFNAAKGANAITVWFERRGNVGRATFYVN
jgi:serine protease Do